MNRFGARVLRIGASLALILALRAVAPARATTFTNVYLVGPGGSGGTIVFGNSSGSTLFAIGTSGSTTYSAGETFVPTPGVLSQITIHLGASTGSPTGSITWSIYSTNGALPNILEGSGTFSPSENSTNTINIDNGPFLFDNFYNLYFWPTTLQTAGNYWSANTSPTDTYPYGSSIYTVNYNTEPVYNFQTARDLYASITTVSGSPPASYINDKLAQPFIISETITLSGLKLNLKKGGTPTGIDTLRLETDLGNMASGALIDANATGTINEEDLTTDYARTEFTFADDVTLPPGKYWPVLSTDRTDPASWVAWAAADFCPSDGAAMRAYNQDVWVPLQVVGLWEPVVVSVELPATEEPTTGHYITLTSGQAASIDYTLTAGDSLIALLLLLLIGLICFSLVVLATRRRP